MFISFLRAVKREKAAYIVKQSLLIGAKSGSRSQSTTLHSTGNISAEDSVHKNKVGHNNTRGIVSSLLFPAETTAAQFLDRRHHHLRVAQ